MHYLQTPNANDVICITIDKYYHNHLISLNTYYYRDCNSSKKDNTFHISISFSITSGYIENIYMKMATVKWFILSYLGLPLSCDLDVASPVLRLL